MGRCLSKLLYESSNAAGMKTHHFFDQNMFSDTTNLYTYMPVINSTQQPLQPIKVLILCMRYF